MGKLLGRLVYKLMPKRRKIAQRNLELCFPDKSTKEVASLVKANFENTGIAMFESGMAWWWPNWRMNRLIHVEGLEHIKNAQQQHQGVLLLFTHVLPLEVMGRVLGQQTPYVGFYRPHNNPLLEWIQHRGRSQGQNEMVAKRDVKGLLKALSKGKVCVYLPDHDYGKNRSVFAPFFAVEEAATTTGTEIFASHKNAVTIPTVLQRLPGTQGYKMEFLKPMDNYPQETSEQSATLINQWVEHSVLENIEQYMWVHRRFKTRPEHNPTSLY